MKKNKMARAMNHVDDEFVVAAEKRSKVIKRSTVMRWGALAAAFVILVGAAVTFLGGNNGTQPDGIPAVDAVVVFDVNPSIELSIDANERVLEAKALNEDAGVVLKDMDLQNVDIDVAVNAIVGSMLKNGYLSLQNNSILVSVNSKDQTKAQELQREISEDIAEILGAKSIDASVITQDFNADEDTVKKAEDHHISVAKAVLIDKIIAAGLKDSAGMAYSYEVLAPLTVNELKMLVESKNVSVENVTSTGSAGSSDYIGRDKALEIALADAGATKDAIKCLEIEMDYERGVMVYNVEFDANKYEYEYDIDAITGKIVDVEKDPEHDHDDDHDDDHNDRPAVDDKNYIGTEKALQAALAHAGLTKDKVRDIDIELEFEMGIMVYSIEFDTAEFEFDYDIDALSGKVVRSEKEKQDIDDKYDDDDKFDDDDDNIPVDTKYISKDEAINKALSHAGLKKSGVTELEAELDKENGKVVYSVEFKSGKYEYDYEINAETGKILKSEKELDND